MLGRRECRGGEERGPLENYHWMFVVVVCNWTGSATLLHPLPSLHSSLSSPVRLSFFLAKTNKKNAPLAEINVAGRAAVAWGVCSRQ